VASPINVNDAPGGPERWSMSCLRNLAAEESRAPTKGNEGLSRFGLNEPVTKSDLKMLCQPQRHRHNGQNQVSLPGSGKRRGTCDV